MKGKKTVFVMGLSFVLYALGWDQLVEVIDPKYIAMATAGVGLLLRFLTDSAVWSPKV